MSLPPQIDAMVRQCFDELIGEATPIIENERRIGLGRGDLEAIDSSQVASSAFVTKVSTLIQLIFGSSDRGKQLIADVRSAEGATLGIPTILGILHGLKHDYEAGLLVSLHEIIEANIASDYMGQAEQLLGEGILGVSPICF